MIPTAEQFITEQFLKSFPDIKEISIEELLKAFAKLHVEQALEEASSSVDSVTCKKTFSDSEIHDSILNAYPLDNIK